MPTLMVPHPPQARWKTPTPGTSSPSCSSRGRSGIFKQTSLNSMVYLRMAWEITMPCAFWFLNLCLAETFFTSLPLCTFFTELSWVSIFLNPSCYDFFLSHVLLVPLPCNSWKFLPVMPFQMPKPQFLQLSFLNLGEPVQLQSMTLISIVNF